MPAPSRLLPVLFLEAANLTSGLGNAVVMLAFPWLVLQETGSAAAAGAVAAISALPALIAAPLTGWLVDRLGRKPVAIGADVVSALSVAAVPIVSMSIGLTYGSILALAIIGAIFDPAGYSARRALIPDAAQASGIDTDRLNGIHEGVFLVGWTAGPLAAAALIAGVGPEAAFWLPCGLFLLAALAVAAMRVGDAGQRGRAEAQAAGTPESGLSELVRGFTALWKDRALRALAIAVLIIAAVYMPTEAVILPVYFNALQNPAGLGIVIAAISGGSMIGAFGYGWILARVRPSVLVRIILIGTTLTVLPMTLLPPLPVLAAFGFLLGLVWGPFNPLFSTLVQRRIRPEEQGRVYGVQLAGFYAAPPIGMVVAGISVDALGVSVTYLALGLLLAACAIPIVFLRSISDLDNTHE
jgi:MFS family permease